MASENNNKPRQNKSSKPANGATAADLTLESILAEYKGSAFIAGDKKTPKKVLQEKTERIMFETTGDGPEPELSNTSEKRRRKAPPRDVSDVMPAGADTDKAPEVPPRPAQRRSASTAPTAAEIERAQRLEYAAQMRRQSVADDDDDQPETAVPKEQDVLPFENLRPIPPDIHEDLVREVSQAIERQTAFETDTRRSARRVFGLFGRAARRFDDDDAEIYDDSDRDTYTYDDDDKPEPQVIEEEYIEEPDYTQTAKYFAHECNKFSTRSFFSLILSLIMAIMTIVFASGVTLPFGLGSNIVSYAGLLLVMLFFVMMFSIEQLIDGIVSLFRGRSNVHTLNLFSCLATAGAAAYTIAMGQKETGLPFCVVSAFSLTFALWGEKIHYRALTETMKTAQSVAAPFGVIAEFIPDLDKTIIKKAADRRQGFYNNLIQADVAETAFWYATPILIVAAAGMALYSSLGQGSAANFLHHFAAIMAAAAPFSAMLAFAVPFSAVARRARQSGAAVAGWGGADDLYFSDGASITDEDLFPAGTISLGGVKVFDDVSPEVAVRYTGSLIIASDSGLSALFAELLRRQGTTAARVEDFQCYEGGIGGVVKGERVITGSAAFMNLMGIRIPPSMNMKNGVFTAVNKKLIAVFTINYVPVKSVQNALVSVLRYRVKLFFSVRDFNVTPIMLEQKFKVPIDDVEYIPIHDSYELSDETKQEAKRVSAILTREGLGPYVEAITGGRRLRNTALIATFLTILSAVGGMVIMYVICSAGAYASASPVNLLLYMASMLGAVLFVCGFAKFRH